jgi:hypothetical protein
VVGESIERSSAKTREIAVEGYVRSIVVTDV